MIDLRPLLPHLPVWLLVLTRLTGLFVFAPLLSGDGVPLRVKIFLALGLSLCIYPILLNPGNPSAALVGHMVDAGMPLAAMPAAVGMELAIGLALGFGASLPMVTMQLAGQIADQQMGIGLGAIFNPDVGESLGVTGQFYAMLATAIFVILGGHRVLLGTLVGSFSHVPLGGFAPDHRLVELLLGLLSSAFELGLRVSAPLLCLIMLETITMGFLARTVPQLNILSVGFALRIFMCIGLIIAGVGVTVSIYAEGLSRALHLLEVYFSTG